MQTTKQGKRTVPGDWRHWQKHPQLFQKTKELVNELEDVKIVPL